MGSSSAKPTERTNAEPKWSTPAARSSRDDPKPSALEKQITKGAERMQSALSVHSRYHRPPRQLQDDYSVEAKVLGSGFNGSVYRATRRGEDGQFAVKEFRIPSSSDTQKMDDLKTECEIFLSLDHPHVVRLTDVYETPTKLTLVMECMHGGELFDRVIAKKRFTEKDASVAAHQMLLAINYLHSNKVVHRDIKLENWLYESEGSDHLKLIDFGFSKIWDNTHARMRASCGTLAYVAPEVLSKSYTSQCDLWSLGIVMFILLAGYMPFSGSEANQMKALKAGKPTWKEHVWRLVSPRGRDFVTQLLTLDAQKRMTAEQALEHPWMVTRQEIRGHRLLSLSSRDGNLVGQSMSGDNVFSIAAPSDMQSNIIRRQVAEALHTQEFELEVLEQERLLGDSDVVQDLNALIVRQNIREGSEEDIPNDIVTDLCQFAQEAKFRRRVMLAMAWSLSNSERKRLRDEFEKMDSNGDGTVTLSEFKKMVEEHFELNDKEIEQCFEAIDDNHNGVIQYSEFLAATVHSRINLDDHLLSVSFKKFDATNSGFVDEATLKSILGEDVSMSDVHEMMTEVDANHDGRISYQEFIDYVRHTDAKCHHQDAAHGALENILTKQPTIAGVGDNHAQPAWANSGQRCHLVAKTRSAIAVG